MRSATLFAAATRSTSAARPPPIAAAASGLTVQVSTRRGLQRGRNSTYSMNIARSADPLTAIQLVATPPPRCAGRIDRPVSSSMKFSTGTNNSSSRSK